MSEANGLYNKYRPSRFEELIGDTKLAQSLQRKLSQPNANHVILFHGPKSSGKTTLARIMATELGAEDYDREELDIGSDGGIATIRDLINESRTVPFGAVKVYIMDEVHGLSADAGRACLKLFEDVPQHLWFFLCTSEPQKLLPTIKSRAYHVELKPHPVVDIVAMLQRGAAGEGVKVPKPFLREIAELANGDARMAFSLLEEFLCSDEADWENLLKGRSFDDLQSEVRDLGAALVEARPSMKEVALILKSLREQKIPPETIRRGVLGYISAVGINQWAGGSTTTRLLQRAKYFATPTYESGFPGVVIAAMSCCEGD